MSSQPPQEVFTDLQFYIWRIRYKPNEQWRPEVLIMGSDAALTTMYEAMESMLADFRANGQSTRKFLCNPPEDIDVVRYAQEHQSELEWLIWLVIRMEPGVVDDTRYEIKNKAVTIRLNESTLNQFLKVLDNQLKDDSQSPLRKKAPGGLFFATDWLGAK